MPIRSLTQGAATTVYACTHPELEGKSGAYLKDCKVGETNRAGQDPELPRKLWEKTEAILASAK